MSDFVNITDVSDIVDVHDVPNMHLHHDALRPGTACSTFTSKPP